MTEVSPAEFCALKDQVDTMGEVHGMRLTTIESKSDDTSGEASAPKVPAGDAPTPTPSSYSAKQLMTAFHRPATGGHESAYATKAFGSYLRKGGASAFEMKKMSEGEDGEGGVLVPDEVSNDIHTKLTERSFMRKLARVTSISTNALDTLVSTKDMDVGWIDEASERAETGSPEFKKIKIPASEMYARLHVTQRLIDDASVDIEAFVADHAADQMAKKETEAFLQGNGVNKPKGLLHYVGNNEIKSVSTGANGAFEGEHPEHKLFELMNTLKTPYLQNAAWILSRSAASAIQKLKEPNQMHFLWQAPAGRETRPFLLGHPVYITDYLPALNGEEATTSALFGNFKEGYQIVDRQDVHVVRDPYSKKPFVEFYTTKRVGGDVINAEAMVALKFAA